MSLWTDTETRELINLWPTASAAQIARRLHRPRYAVTAKATRLIRDGALRDVAKHFKVNPWPNRARPVHRTIRQSRRRRLSTPSSLGLHPDRA
jgi:hypothetical protein